MFRIIFPNKIFNYMAESIPTVLAIDGVIRDVIDKSGGGIVVPPGDDAALAAAVMSLVSNPGKVLKMGSAARDYVVRYFNRFDQAQGFVGLVNRMGKVRSS
jgi:glycosyltransferase involved in cell wall biosynthesis